ncbi:MAG TPA: hypothetical protein VN920_03600 [Pyrinomonadaceae bacterium]|nr:hypothetical protein [Pyrinomonadaceae bacterium]
MDYPERVMPRSIEQIVPPSRGKVMVPKATPRFRPWPPDALPEDRYRKCVLDFEGEMTFAELATLRIFQNSGWQGRWIDSYGRRYLTSYWPRPVNQPLAPEQQEILDRISVKAGIAGGCFDVAGAVIPRYSSNPNGRDMMRSMRIRDDG